MDTGTVKWFNNVKGFGFVTPDDGGRDLFVHYSEVQMKGYRNLEQGQRVRYEFSDGPKGPHATKIEVTEEGATAEVPQSAEQNETV